MAYPFNKVVVVTFEHYKYLKLDLLNWDLLDC